MFDTDQVAPKPDALAALSNLLPKIKGAKNRRVDILVRRDADETLATHCGIAVYFGGGASDPKSSGANSVR